jgi:hypothetical protein
MAKNETRRLAQKTLLEDETAYDALLKMTGYASVNPAYAPTALAQAYSEMNATQTLANQAEAAFITTLDAAINKEWAFHKLMLGVKEQVIAHYGKDSPQVKELGLKRKSEYKTRKAKAPISPKPAA